jgi:NADH-quinone oxidoreductase subunit L
VTAWLLVAVPFVAAIAGPVAGQYGRRASAWAALGGAALTLLIALGVALSGPWQHPKSSTITTVPTGLVPVSVTANLDGLAAVVGVMVAVVALLVQIYSIAYMEHHPRYPSYSAFISLFTAAMLLVVVSGDLIVLLIGWEVMGICSYFLIGQYWEEDYARSAAVKAFLVTRIGDVGFLFGIFVLGAGARSFRITDVVAAVPHLSSTQLTVGTLLLTCGVVGKSAQFPLHVWLPDAMAGPTPISALIHAATMVAAGVYLIVRLYPVYVAAPTTLAVLGVIACVTMLGSALCALAQDDIKRVLAWSTVSQLAYMFGALAVGGRDAAVFHLLTHAAFKALLFLAAGAVIHAVGTNFMSHMGGLGRSMPVTFWSMTVGLAALVGIPPLAGFFSKESILGAAADAAYGGGQRVSAVWVAWLVLLFGLMTVLVTAAYATRLWLLTFMGPTRFASDSVAPHEPPPLMRWPIVALVWAAIISGVIGLSGAWLPTWATANQPFFTGTSALQPMPTSVPLRHEALTPAWETVVVALILAIVGIGLMWRTWRRDPAMDPAVALGRWRQRFADGFGVDRLYDRWFVTPVQKLARRTVWVDDGFVDEAVEGTARGALLTARVLRQPMTGNVQTYLTGALAGVAVVAAVAGAVVLL